MLDFTCALYLGLTHPSSSLRAWPKLTAGRPAVLGPLSGEDRVAAELAALQGCEAAVLGASTLHLFWDVFGLMNKDNVSVYLDSGCYPIAGWGALRAASRGVAVWKYPHQDAAALKRRLNEDSSGNSRIVIVSDGFCPSCGKAAPVKDYLEILKCRGGRLVLDDTQTLGILGQNPSHEMPYGRGGGGILRWLDVRDPNVLAVSSLAKGFGVPLAVLAGRRSFIRKFKTTSETRVHCSSPSAAHLQAAFHALDVNRDRGDVLRRCLLDNVRRFRKGVREIGLDIGEGLFPVQTLRLSSSRHAVEVHGELLRNGIKTVLRRGHKGQGPCLSFIITVCHRPGDIDRAVSVLGRTEKKRISKSSSEEIRRAQSLYV